MWRLCSRRKRQPQVMPVLPYGKAYYAVIDVEALVTSKIDIVEQVAIVVVDAYGREVVAEKHMIYQPMEAAEISSHYGIEPSEVQRAIDGYKLVTRDNYVHSDAVAFEKWNVVRRRIVQICQAYAVAVYAKGIALEFRVFYGELPFWDLAWWGAPKYPGEVHDPLRECRFFSQFIPDLINNSTVYLC